MFKVLKEILVSVEVLVYYDKDVKIRVIVDVSLVGLGVVFV